MRICDKHIWGSSIDFVFYSMSTRKHSDEVKQTVLALYREGLEIKKICKLTGVHKDYPTQVAQEIGIGRGSGKVSEISPKLFELGTAASNYWIGYLVSDGNIYATTRNNRVSLASKDDEVRDKFLAYSNCNYFQQKFGMHVMHFGSKAIVAYLDTIGIRPKKSLNISLPSIIDSHLLRGIFDGDGSVHNKRPTCKITTGSENLGNQIVLFLEQNDIFSKLRRRRNTNHFDVWVERRADFRKFYTLIYHNSHSAIQLDRKHTKFVASLSN